MTDSIAFIVICWMVLFGTYLKTLTKFEKIRIANQYKLPESDVLKMNKAEKFMKRIFQSSTVFFICLIIGIKYI